MTIVLAGFHYIGLALGFAAIVLRARALRASSLTHSTREILFADNLWGIAALLWIATGLTRVFGNYEKGSAYYLHNHWFFAKMGLFALLLILEIWPMVTFLRWRIRRKVSIDRADHGTIGKLEGLSWAEAALVLIIPFLAALMARGGFVER